MYRNASEDMAIYQEAFSGYAAASTTMEAEWLTFEETAEFLRVSRATMYRLIDSSTLVPYQIPGLRGSRFKKKDLDELFKPVVTAGVIKAAKQSRARSKPKRKRT